MLLEYVGFITSWISIEENDLIWWSTIFFFFLIGKPYKKCQSGDSM